MIVEILKGQYNGKIGELQYDGGWDKWSSVYINHIGVIYINKIFLREIEDEDNQN